MKTTELLFKWADRMAADLDAAKTSVLITSLSMHPPRANSQNAISRLWGAMQAAAARGVMVDVVLAATSKSHPATAFNNAAAQTLYAAGCRAHAAPVGRLLHAKTACIDDAIIWIGSGNWTAAASEYNHEAYLRAESPELAARLRGQWVLEGFING